MGCGSRNETDKITREEGIALVKKYDQEIPKTFLKDILEYLDISESYFWKVIEKHRNLKFGRSAQTENGN